MTLAAQWIENVLSVALNAAALAREGAQHQIGTSLIDALECCPECSDDEYSDAIDTALRNILHDRSRPA